MGRDEPREGVARESLAGVPPSQNPACLGTRLLLAPFGSLGPWAAGQVNCSR